MAQMMTLHCNPNGEPLALCVECSVESPDWLGASPPAQRPAPEEPWAQYCSCCGDAEDGGVWAGATVSAWLLVGATVALGAPGRVHEIVEEASHLMSERRVHRPSEVAKVVLMEAGLIPTPD